MAGKSKDIRKMSDEELEIEIRDARRTLFDLRTQQVTEKIEDTSQFTKKKRQIARLLTELKARQSQEVEVTK